MTEFSLMGDFVLYESSSANLECLYKKTKPKKNPVCLYISENLLRGSAETEQFGSCPSHDTIN